MVLFWSIVALMALIAVAFFAPALLGRRAGGDASERDRQNVAIARERLAELEEELRAGLIDQAGFEQARTELEQSLLIDLGDGQAGAVETGGGRRGLVALAALAVVVPVATLSIYLSLGSPQLVDGRAAAPAVAAHGSGSGGAMPSLDEMVGGLRAKLEQNPEDSEGWYLLGRTYIAMEDYANAAQAYERLYALVGDEPRVMLSLADAQAMAQSGSMEGRPAELVRKAVRLVPNDTTALWLAGIAEDQAGNHREAIGYWNRLRPLLQGDAASLQRVDNLIARAMEQGGIEAPPAQAAPAATTAGKGIRVRVDLDPGLRAGVSPDDVVFVFARALNGPRMPLAAARHRVADLPVEVTLDDSSAMAPEMKLSGFDQVTVGARVSLSGNPIASSGDLTGEVSPVQTAEGGLVSLVIDARVP